MNARLGSDHNRTDVTVNFNRSFAKRFKVQGYGAFAGSFLEKRTVSKSTEMALRWNLLGTFPEPLVSSLA
jgi:hypothetical protein